MRRATFIAATAVAAALVTDACAKSVPKELELVESAREFDYKALVAAVTKTTDVRQLWDIDGYEPTALGAIKSAYNGYQFGYAVAPSQIGMVACLHGYANAFAYDDTIWNTYKIGQSFGFKDPGGNVVATNIFYHARTTETAPTDPNARGSMYQDGTLEALQRRGLTVLICHTAAAEQAGMFVRAGIAPTGLTPSDVLADLLAHVVPGVIVVPSMVATIGLLQNRFKYAYTTVNPT